MNISGAGLSSFLPSFDYTVAVSGPKAAKKASIETGEDAYTSQMIEKFKADNNPTARKISQIMGKFMGGKELTEEELNYLAKNAPENYQMVQEAVMERKALEMRLKAAKTKLEALQAYQDTVSNIKATKGTGETEKHNAIKTMGRINGAADAYGKFVSTAEYRELEDEGDNAAEIAEQAAGCREKGEVSTEAPAEAPIEVPAKEPEPATERTEINRPEDEGRSNDLGRENQEISSVSGEFRRKVHELYKKNKKSEAF